MVAQAAELSIKVLDGISSNPSNAWNLYGAMKGC